MKLPTNAVSNSSEKNVWLTYSVANKSGGKYDEWRVRMLRAGLASKHIVDLDYIKAADGFTIKKKSGWWKLKQGQVYTLYSDKNDDKNIEVVTNGGGFTPWIEDLRYFEDWARQDGKKPEEIKAQIEEWEALKDPLSPIVAEDKWYQW